MVYDSRARNRAWPDTITAAVDRLLAILSPDDLLTIFELPRHKLPRLCYGLGRAVRNSFGLSRGNTPLLASCAACAFLPAADARQASDLIIRALWQRLHSGCEPRRTRAR